MRNIEYPIIQRDKNKRITKLALCEYAEIYLGEFLWGSFKKIKGISDAYSITVTNSLTGDVPYYQSIGTVEDLEKFIVIHISDRFKWEKV